MKNIKIIYEDRDIIVCEKPPGVPVQSDKSRALDLVNILRNYRADKEELSDIPYIGLVHRLDRPVGGIMVFAKNKKSADLLSKQIQNGDVKKKYMAVSTKTADSYIPGHYIVLEDYLYKDPLTNTSKVVSKDMKGAKRAKLSYRICDVTDSLSLIEIELMTGRHHQIRVQLSHAGLPLWGDLKYNSMEKLPEWTNVALYSYFLEFFHPASKKRMSFCSIPDFAPFSVFSITAP